LFLNTFISSFLVLLSLEGLCMSHGMSLAGYWQRRHRWTVAFCNWFESVQRLLSMRRDDSVFNEDPRLKGLKLFKNASDGT